MQRTTLETIQGLDDDRFGELKEAHLPANDDIDEAEAIAAVLQAEAVGIWIPDDPDAYQKVVATPTLAVAAKLVWLHALCIK